MNYYPSKEEKNASIVNEQSNGLRQRMGFEKSASPNAYGDRSSREKSQSNSGSESPKPGRRRLGSIADEIDVSQRNGESTSTGAGGGATNTELEAMKQEILNEMRKEMDKMKQDIIDGK